MLLSYVRVVCCGELVLSLKLFVCCCSDTRIVRKFILLVQSSNQKIRELDLTGHLINRT